MPRRSLDATLRRVHRIIAILFLASIPPTAYASFTGDPASPSVLVYVPLFPLLGLTVTGSYMLIRPWVLRWRAGRPRRDETGRSP